MSALLAFVARLADPLFMIAGDKAWDGNWTVTRS